MTPNDEPQPLSLTAKKLEESRDAVAALRKAMEERLSAKPAPSAPPPPIEPIVEAVPKEEIFTDLVAEKPPIETTTETPPPAPDAPQNSEAKTDEAPIHFDPVEWSHIMMHVAQRSQGLLRDYMDRTRNKPLDMSVFSIKPILDSLSQLTSNLLNDPETYTNAQLATWQNYIDLTRATLLRMQGIQTKPIAEAPASDKRFKGKDWQNNWMFDFLKQAYLKTAEEARHLVRQESAHIEYKAAQKIEFYSRLFFDASAPNNFWMTNPEVLRVTLASKGENLIKGLQNLLQDLESGKGMLRIKMSDYRSFELGKNIACTPGKVVYQNDLMQLIQYAPATENVRQVPLLIIPPWINKYYILDLKQKNSFIRHLVAQGYTVFCISWVNPAKAHAAINFEDYMDRGALTALREIKRLTGSHNANLLGYCIGGTLLACLQAYLAALSTPQADVPRIASATYLVTMIDFAEPGDLGVFIDEDQIRMLEDRMQRQGYMDAASMVMAFNMLRPNDLIWPFVINNYMLGREPFPFDILYWNADSTNLPATMQSYYLRNMYLDNKLASPNALAMKGVKLDLTQITTPSFVLATREDHIAPWRSAYAATQIYKGPVTFVLSGSGHIAGIVNPPQVSKYGYLTNESCPSDPDAWLSGAVSHPGSWWPEWIKWLDQYSGSSIPGRTINESIEDAPGSYVRVRAV